MIRVSDSASPVDRDRLGHRPGGGPAESVLGYSDGGRRRVRVCANIPSVTVTVGRPGPAAVRLKTWMMTVTVMPVIPE